MKTLYVSCAIIRNSEGKVLLAKRPFGKQEGGKWEFPGGKLEKDESPENCIKREIKEELLVDSNILKRFPEVKLEKDIFSLVMYPFEIETFGTIKITEHLDICFFYPKEIEFLDKPEIDVLVWNVAK